MLPLLPIPAVKELSLHRFGIEGTKAEGDAEDASRSDICGEAALELGEEEKEPMMAAAAAESAPAAAAPLVCLFLELARDGDGDEEACGWPRFLGGCEAQRPLSSTVPTMKTVSRS